MMPFDAEKRSELEIVGELNTLGRKGLGLKEYAKTFILFGFNSFIAIETLGSSRSFILLTGLLILFHYHGLTFS